MTDADATTANLTDEPSNSSWVPLSHVPDFRPQIRPELLIDRIDTEAIVWNPAMPDPTYLDPVAALLIQVFDGTATSAELAEDVSVAMGVDIELATGQVQRVIRLLLKNDLLAGAPTEPRLPKRSVLPDPDW